MRAAQLRGMVPVHACSLHRGGAWRAALIEPEDRPWTWLFARPAKRPRISSGGAHARQDGVPAAKCGGFTTSRSARRRAGRTPFSLGSNHRRCARSCALSMVMVPSLEARASDAAPGVEPKGECGAGFRGPARASYEPGVAEHRAGASTTVGSLTVPRAVRATPTRSDTVRYTSADLMNQRVSGGTAQTQRGGRCPSTPYAVLAKKMTMARPFRSPPHWRADSHGTRSPKTRRASEACSRARWT